MKQNQVEGENKLTMEWQKECWSHILKLNKCTPTPRYKITSKIEQHIQIEMIIGDIKCNFKLGRVELYKS